MKKLNIILFLLGFMALAFNPGNTQAQIITTIAGVGLGNDSLATKAELLYPLGVTKDNSGNIYVVDNSSYQVRKISPAGIITAIAGNGSAGWSGDGGPATAAQLGTLYAVTLDRAGNIYIADIGYGVIRKINTAGIISTIAGNATATSGYSGDGGPATAARLNSPSDVIADTSGNLFIADWQNHVVRKINTAGIISTVVGDGYLGALGNGGPATACELGSPFKLNLDKLGNLYIAETDSELICKVDPAGIITIIAGTNTFQRGLDGDGGPATACTMTQPGGIASDTSGNVYFSDTYNGRIRVINKATGIISNFAGTGSFNFAGDGGPAAAAEFTFPFGIFHDVTGNLIICDGPDNLLRQINATGTISTIAGRCGRYTDGYAAVNAEICTPANIATDLSGNVFIADYDNHRIQEINASTGVISTVAGNGIPGYGSAMLGDGGPATNAHLYFPNSMTLDNAGNMYVIDNGNNRIRKVNTAGIINTIAGNDTAGYNGDNRPATSAFLLGPVGIAADTSGNIYIADQFNSRIRKVNAAGIITTLAGTGSTTFSGDGGPATNAKINNPAGVAADYNGNIFIADGSNYRVRKVHTPNVAVPGADLNPQSIIVYPNPAHDQLHIDVSGGNTTGIQIMMYDITGKIVYQAPMQHDKHTIDMQQMASGVYIMQLSNSKGIAKIVKVVKD